MEKLKLKYDNRDKESHTRKMTEYVRNRRRTDKMFAIICNLRNRLNKLLRGKVKAGSAVKDLGCSRDELRAFLEHQFEPGMNWNNYGNKEGQWNIDHVIPLSKVDLTNKTDLLEVCNYLNLRPMWCIDNIKKSNKI